MFGMGSGVTAEVGFVFAICVWAFLFHLLSCFFSFVTEWCAQGRFLHSSILMSPFFFILSYIYPLRSTLSRSKRRRRSLHSISFTSFKTPPRRM